MVSYQGERLREERERLGLTQSQMGELAGVTKKSQINYEKGERHPDSVYLAAIAAAGADVLYILTGQRSSASPPAPAAPPITEGERTLLNLFNAAPAQVQEGVRTTLGAFGPAADQRNTKGRAA